MHVSEVFLNEIYTFLNQDLLSENLTNSTKLKLRSILSKFDIIKQNEEEPTYEEPLNQDTNLKLPVKVNNSDRVNTIITLSGGLYYRYNLQCWDYYPFCCLHQSRIICEKSNSNLQYNNFQSSNAGKSGGLCTFILGYNAVEIGNDCGMKYVFKLTHPTEDTKVFATETEEECLVWIEQINQYSLGITPIEERCFFKQISNDLLDESDYLMGSGNVATVLSSGSDSGCPPVSSFNDVEGYSHLRRQPSDVLSIINNNDQTANINGSTIATNQVQCRSNVLISDKKFNRSRSSYTFKNPPQNLMHSNSNSSNNSNLSMSYNVGNGGVNSGSGSGQSNSIISSMRRKVESIGNKYRNRKSFGGFTNTSNNNHRHSLFITNYEGVPVLSNGGGGGGGIHGANSFVNEAVFNSSNLNNGVNNTNGHVNNHQLRARTMPQASPADDILQNCRRLSTFSIRPQNSIDAIYSGVAKLRIQGNRGGWIERWCQLKPKLLECYHIQPVNNSNNNSSNNNSNNNSNNSIINTSSSSCGSVTAIHELGSLDFALCLDNLTLGLSNDKKHRSAVRLSCEKVEQDLLFEVLDKVLMGDWIKAFIEALGISSRNSRISNPDSNSIDLSPPPHNSGFANKTIGNNQTKISKPNSQHDCVDIMERSLTTIHSESIYDEVCSNGVGSVVNCKNYYDMKTNENGEKVDDLGCDGDEELDIYSLGLTNQLQQNSYRNNPHSYNKNNGNNTNNNYSHRRWSSPMIQSPFKPPSPPSSSPSALSTTSAVTTNVLSSTAGTPYFQLPGAPLIGRRSIRDHPLPSLPASSPDSETNSDSMAETPTGCNANITDTINSISTIASSSSLNTNTNKSIHVNTETDNLFNTLKNDSTQCSDELTSTLKNSHPPEFITDTDVDYNGYLSSLNSAMTLPMPRVDSLKSSGFTYADQTLDNEKLELDQIGDFHANKDQLRVQGCSFADLIARFEPSEADAIEREYSHSSSTMSSKTGSSSTSGTYHGSSGENRGLFSISASYNSVNSFEQQTSIPEAAITTEIEKAGAPKLLANNDNLNAVIGLTEKRQKVCRSVSADTDLGNVPFVPANRKDRPKSLLMKKTSLELVFEEMSTVKADIRQLKKYKKEIQRSNSSSVKSSTSNNENLGSINLQISQKEGRLKELSSYSKKRFTKAKSFSSMFLNCIYEVEVASNSNQDSNTSRFSTN